MAQDAGGAGDDEGRSGAGLSARAKRAAARASTGSDLWGPKRAATVVFVALGIAAAETARVKGGDGVGVGLAESVEEVEEVVGVLAGGVESDDEQHGSLPQGDAFQALAEAGVAGGGLGELQFVGGGLEVVLEEGDVVAVAGRVDSDAAASGRLRGGSRLW